MYGPLRKPEETISLQPGVHQLFLDDYLVSERDNLRRTRYQPTKYAGNPIMVPEHPWEGKQVLLFGTVIRDEEDGIFKMWYQADYAYGILYACYATSSDGIHWKKPTLGVTEALGSHENNIVFYKDHHPYYSQMNTVIRDSDDPDPQRRYKMTFCLNQPDPNVPEGLRNYGSSTSPDGIHWTARQDPAIISPENASDTSFLMRDTISGKYVHWGRTNIQIHGKEKRFGRFPATRAVARSESEDFAHWTEPKVVFMPEPEYDKPESQVHAVGVFVYEGMYIGMVQMLYQQLYEGYLDVYLATSRDGWHWEKPPARPIFLECGGLGEWDRFNQSVAGDMLIMGDELWMYYAGRTRRHGPYNGPDSGPDWGAIGLAKLRRDGFCSMDAGFDTGSVTTVPLSLPEGDIHLNVKSDFGTAHIEVLTEDWQPIPGGVSAPVTADSCSAAVRFPGGFSVASLEGRPARLQFHLCNARLFAFWVE